MQVQFFADAGGNLRRLTFIEASGGDNLSELSDGSIVISEPTRHNFDGGPFASQLVVDLAVLEKGVESSLV
jgi:hypothetical protein